MKKAKKLLSVILTFCMIMTTIGAIAPITASAANEDVLFDGSANDQFAVTGSGVTLTSDVGGVGGKAANDVAYKLEVTDATAAATAKADTGMYYQVTQGTHSKPAIFLSFDMYLTEGAKLKAFFELSKNSGITSKRGTFTYVFSEDGLAGSDGDLPTYLSSLSANEWHKVDIAMSAANSRVGWLYIDGEQIGSSFTTVSSGAGGVRDLYLQFTGTNGSVVYIDNYIHTTIDSVDIANEYPASWGYADGALANHKATEISVSGNNGVTYDSETKTVTVNGDVAADAVKAEITTSDTVRIFTSNTYRTEITGDAIVTDGAVLVTENAAGAFAYYSVTVVGGSVVPGPEPEPEPDPEPEPEPEVYVPIYNGSDRVTDAEGNVLTTQVGLTNNTDGDADGILPVAFQAKVGAIGGKAESDYAYKFTATDTDDTKFNSAYVAPQVVGPQSADSYVSFDVYLTEGANLKIYIENYTSATEDTGTGYYICLNENGFAGSTAIMKTNNVTNSTNFVNALTSLSTNEWHKVALNFNGNSRSAAIYVDGARIAAYYTHTAATCGLRRFRFAFADSAQDSSVYIDNYMFTNSTEITGWPEQWGFVDNNNLANHKLPAEISVSANDYITYDSDTKTISALGGTTAKQVKDNVSTSDTVRIYKDSTYKIELGDSDEVEDGAVLVVETAYGAFAYYNISVEATNNTIFEYCDNLDGTCLITGFNVDPSTVKDIVIPETIAGLKVTEIDAYVLYTCENLESVRFFERADFAEIGANVMAAEGSDKYDESKLFGDLAIYIPKTITTIPNSLLKDFKNGANVTIYGEWGSAAHTYYKEVKAALEAGTYKNEAGGSLASISFVEYDFLNNAAMSDATGINKGGDIAGLEAYFKNDSETDTNVEILSVEAGGGKLAGDKSLYYETTDGNSGKNRIDNNGTDGTFYLEFAARAPEKEENYVNSVLNYWKNAGFSEHTSLTIINIYPDRIEVGGEKVMDAKAGRWYTVAVEVPNDGSQGAKVYVNGTAHEVELDYSCYGVRRMATSAYSRPGVTQASKFYIDNYRAYTSATHIYNPKTDKPATLVSSDSEKAKIVSDKLCISENAVYTVADYKAILSAERANIRFYSDSTFNTLLNDTDELKAGAVVVVGTTLAFDFEKVVTYYDVVKGITVENAAVYGDGSRTLNGTDYDIRYGYEKLTYKSILKSYNPDDETVTLTLSLVDKDGAKVVDDVVKSIPVSAGATVEVEEDILVGDGIQAGYKVTAKITRASGADAAAPVEFTFSADKQEIHVLLIANSFGNDSFSYINDIAEAAGITLKAQNMYIGSAPITLHYKNIKNNLSEYSPRNVGLSESISISVKDALDSDKWDIVALQAATHGSSNDLAFVDYETWTDDGSLTGVSGLTSEQLYTFIKDYIATNEPGAKRIMHMSWGPCEEVSRTMYDGRFADEETYPSAREALYAAQKAGYEYASSIFSTAGEGQMVPTAIAMDYALKELGIKEHSGPKGDDSIGSYKNPVAGEVSLFRDETCHLTYNNNPYGRVLAGLTWYEYLTGNDARENPYQNDLISPETMALLKEAAHYANTQVVDINGNMPEPEAEAEVVINVAGGKATVEVNGINNGEAPATATYKVGTALKYTAVAENSANQTFLYWKDMKNDAIVSNNEVLNVIVGSDCEYTAVFVDKTGDIYITFKSANKIIAEGLKGTFDVPADPYVAGYTFNGWYVDGVKTAVNLDNVSENTTYVAGFTLDATTYTVTTTGAVEAGGAYKYNERVTVTPAGEEGKVFTYWTRDGKIVSYSNEYSFYVNADTTIVANYAVEAQEAQIVLVMAEPVIVSGNKIGFYAERNVPNNYTVVETGILLSQNAEFDENSDGVLKAKASSLANIGQYTVRKKDVVAGDTWYGKAYLIYSDGTDIYTVYSNTVSKTL